MKRWGYSGSSKNGGMVACAGWSGKIIAVAGTQNGSGRLLFHFKNYFLSCQVSGCLWLGFVVVY